MHKAHVDVDVPGAAVQGESAHVGKGGGRIGTDVARAESGAENERGEVTEGEVPTHRDAKIAKPRIEHAYGAHSYPAVGKVRTPPPSARVTLAPHEGERTLSPR